MKADYKNWMPRGMVLSTLGGSLACLILYILLLATRFAGTGTLDAVLRVVLLVAFVGLACAGIWMVLMYRAFSYNGKRQMSRQIIEGTAQYVRLPDGGEGLDVGCGSGALAIACAKRNPRATMLGVDRWGPEYAGFNQPVCEKNAKAEGVKNVRFAPGNAIHLDFPDERFDAVTSNYVYHNIVGHDKQALLLETLRVLKKGGTFAIHDIMSKSRYGDMQAFAKKLRDMGYEKVELIDTTDGKFMTRREALWMALSGSTLLVGRK